MTLVLKSLMESIIVLAVSVRQIMHYVGEQLTEPESGGFCDGLVYIYVWGEKHISRLLSSAVGVTKRVLTATDIVRW